MNYIGNTNYTQFLSKPAGQNPIYLLTFGYTRKHLTHDETRIISNVFLSKSHVVKLFRKRALVLL